MVDSLSPFLTGRGKKAARATWAFLCANHNRSVGTVCGYGASGELNFLAVSRIQAR